MPDTTTANPQSLDATRIRYGFLIALAGFALVLAVFLTTAFKGSETLNATIGGVTSLVGTLVGLFLGSQVGSARVEAAEEGRKAAEARATAFAAAVEPQRGELVLRSLGLSN